MAINCKGRTSWNLVSISGLHDDRVKLSHFFMQQANGILLMDGQEGRQEQKGCDTRYYQKDVDKVPNADGTAMVFPTIITCQCGARLRAYGQIARFRD